MRFKQLFAIGSVILLTACASFNSPVQETSEKGLQLNSQFPASMGKARTFFQEGKYNEAIGQYKRLLKSKDPNIIEMSQYQIAYTLAFYKNPKKDFQEALAEFQVFMKRFPASRLKEDAANWVYLISHYLSKKSENEKLRDDIKKLVDIDIEAEQKQNQLR